MPYQIPVLEKLPALAPETKVLVQPKYDGTQGIFTSIAGRAVALTRSGTELFGLREAAVAMLELTRKNLGQEYTIFAEVEPFPWSESGKWALPGKLILGTPVKWKATVFDICPTTGFFAGDYLRKSAYLDRYSVLKSIEDSLTGCGLAVAPIQEEEFGRAIAAVNKSFYKDSGGRFVPSGWASLAKVWCCATEAVRISSSQAWNEIYTLYEPLGARRGHPVGWGLTLKNRRVLLRYGAA